MNESPNEPCQSHSESSNEETVITPRRRWNRKTVLGLFFTAMMCACAFIGMVAIVNHHFAQQYDPHADPLLGKPCMTMSGKDNLQTEGIFVIENDAVVCNAELAEDAKPPRWAKK